MPLRTEAEIQRAHDLLVGIVMGDAGGVLPHQRDNQLFCATASVLCWALQHDHNIQFGTLLAELERIAKECGFELVKGSVHTE
jgi:hypothetical protein